MAPFGVLEWALLIPSCFYTVYCRKWLRALGAPFQIRRLGIDLKFQKVWHGNFVHSHSGTFVGLRRVLSKTS
eukprot:2910024-Amphidinium_carterae.1